MLTTKQRRLHAFILDRQLADGVAPSYEEMAKAMGLHSKSGVHRMVVALEERGWLRRLPNRARAIEALPAPMRGDAPEAPDAASALAVATAIGDPDRRRTKAAYVAAARALERLAWENGIFVEVRVDPILLPAVADAGAT